MWRATIWSSMVTAWNPIRSGLPVHRYSLMTADGRESCPTMTPQLRIGMTGFHLSGRILLISLALTEPCRAEAEYPRMCRPCRAEGSRPACCWTMAYPRGMRTPIPWKPSRKTGLCRYRSRRIIITALADGLLIQTGTGF